MTPPGSEGQPPSGKKEFYCAALREHLARASETSLGKAYELGREFLTSHVSLLELAAIHHSALEQIAVSESPRLDQTHLLRAAEFLSEVLSPYEMAHRGFQDAIGALRRMNEVLEEEIKRIAYSVHDEASQLLVAVHLALADLSHDVPAHQHRFDQIADLLKQVEAQLRQYSHELRPTILDDFGLVPAIRSLADAVSKRANLPVHVGDQGTGRLPPSVEIAVYRVVQEALSNAVKHSGATSVSIEFSAEGSAVVCLVRDDGRGLPVESLRQNVPRKGLGLIAMRERLYAVGGSIQFESAPNSGTTVRIWVPGNFTSEAVATGNVTEDHHAYSHHPRR